MSSRYGKLVIPYWIVSKVLHTCLEMWWNPVSCVFHLDGFITRNSFTLILERPTYDLYNLPFKVFLCYQYEIYSRLPTKQWATVKDCLISWSCQDTYLLVHLSPPRRVNGYYQIVWTKKHNSGAVPVMGSVHHIEPHIAREMLEQSFISTIRPTIHSSLSRKGSSSKTFLKLEIFGNAGFAFSCGWKHFENGALPKRWGH